MRIERIEDFALSPVQVAAIAELLQQSFPEYPSGKIYFRQCPHFRFLAWDETTLLGQMSVEYRLVNNNHQVRRIFGVTDFCVAKDFQNQKVATKMLLELEDLGRRHRIDFLLLLTRDQDVYRRWGFKEVNNQCRWLLIQHHQSIGLIDRPMPEGLMVKPLGAERWAPGRLDFLGHIF